jgi:NAD(P)-dependent dehydrogenase (short-subunit alcohol dehydrogenase family)
MAPGWRKHSGWHAAGPRVLLLNHNNCYPTNVDPISEAITALPPEIRRHFGLESVPGESSSRPLGKLLDLTGLAVLVTGGGGPDLGSALCRRLASQGALIGVLDVDAAAAKAVAAELGEITGRDHIPLAADVSDWAGVHAAVAEFADRAGQLDVLINNAGGALGTHGPFATRTQADMDAVVAVNLVGVLYATHAALTPMRARGRGRVVTIASEGGRIAMRDLGVYNTCKAGVIAFMRNLAREVGADGISTVTVCPGGLLAPKLVERMAAWPGPLASAIDQGLAATPLGRFGLPDEVAVAVAFLVSEAGEYINGTELSVGGGQSA